MPVLRGVGREARDNMTAGTAARQRCPMVLVSHVQSGDDANADMASKMTSGVRHDGFLFSVAGLHGRRAAILLRN